MSSLAWGPALAADVAGAQCDHVCHGERGLVLLVLVLIILSVLVFVLLLVVQRIATTEQLYAVGEAPYRCMLAGLIILFL